MGELDLSDGERRREQRVAKNEAWFRDANEVLERDALTRGMSSAAFICECSSVGCVDRIGLTRFEYERARARGDLFIIVPGHEDSSVEEVVERHPTFFLVEKQGLAGAIARAADPR